MEWHGQVDTVVQQRREMRQLALVVSQTDENTRGGITRYRA
jgi:hypothetical protein